MLYRKKNLQRKLILNSSCKRVMKMYNFTFVCEYEELHKLVKRVRICYSHED